MTNTKLTDTHLAVKSELDGYRMHASRGQHTARAMVRLFESIDCELTELQERRKSFRWISIDEELPEDESTVIVKNIDGVQWVADFSDDCFYPDEFPVYKMGGDEVTHWMRFPE